MRLLYEDIIMRLNSQEQRDQAGFAIELIKRTVMSHPPCEAWNDWMKAVRLLDEAQEILIKTSFYSKEFDPKDASY